MKGSGFYKNKVVLITGSSMGIGKELAKQILDNSGKVVITGRDETKLKAIEIEFEEYSDSMLTVSGDITNYETNEMLIQKTIDHFGQLDILITNAGLSGYGEVENMNPQIAKQIIDTNIYGTLFPIKAAIPELKKTKGSVLLVSSLAGLKGLPGYAAYSLSKMSLTALAESLTIELKSYGIYIGIAYLGFTENEKTKRTLNPKGKLEEVPIRPKRFTSTREATAEKILRQVSRCEHKNIHSLLGKFANFLNKYLSPVMNIFLTKNYHRSASN